MALQDLSDEELSKLRGQHVEEIQKLDGEIVYAILHRRRLEQRQLEGKRAQGFLMLKNIDEEFNQRKVTPENK